MLPKPLIFFLLMTGFAPLSAQGVHPEVQAKIDSLQAWITDRVSKGESLDPLELESWNQRIRKAQDELKNSPPSEMGIQPHSGPGAEMKTMSGYVGTSFQVPVGKQWKIRKVTCSAGLGEYQILVKSIPFPSVLNPGETLKTPSFSSEAALLTEDQTEIIYTFEILEFQIGQ
jgi:hypothetical protein